MNRRLGRGEKAPPAPGMLTALGSKKETGIGMPGILNRQQSREPTKKSFNLSSNVSQIESLPCDPSDLIEKVQSLPEDSPKANQYVAFILNKLKAQRNSLQNKLDPIIVSSLCFLSMKRSSIFQNESIRELLYQMFKTEGLPQSARVKGSQYQQICLMTINILWSSHRGLRHWPLRFMALYLEDSYKNREWVDHPLCANFTSNIKMSFGTKPIPPERQTWSAELNLGLQTETPLNRFSEEPQLNEYVAGIINEQVQKRTGDTTSRNLVITCGYACGLQDVRRIVSAKIDIWLMNQAKLSKVAYETLHYCCANIDGEADTIENIMNVRCKTESTKNQYFQAITMMCENPVNQFLLVQRIIYSDLQNNRNPFSFNIINYLIHHSQAMRISVTKNIAAVFNAVMRETCLDDARFYAVVKVLRTMIREIAKTSRSDVADFLPDLNESYFNDARGFGPGNEQDPAIIKARSNMTNGWVDLVHLSMQLRTNPIRDTILQTKTKFNVSQDPKQQTAEKLAQNAALEAFRSGPNSLPIMQQKAIRWVQGALVKNFFPADTELHEILLKLLFIKKEIQVNEYDNWPPENERNYIFTTLSSQDICEGTLTRLAFIGTQFFPAQGLSLIWTIVVRCCENGGTIKVENPEQIAEKILELVWVQKDQAQTQIKNGKLGTRASLWKAWVVILLLASQNPSTIGKYGWDTFPQLQLLISYCITGNVITTADQDQLIQRQVNAERDELLRAESEASGLDQLISPDESTYLQEYCTLQPNTDLRIPPQSVLESISKFNKSIKLDSKLSENRDPDFLLLLMDRRVDGGRGPDSGGSLDWVNKLVRNSDSFKSLPVQILAEYSINVMMSAADHSEAENDFARRRRENEKRKQREIILHLQQISFDERKLDEKPLIEHLIGRLGNPSFQIRSSAFKLLQVILKDPKDPDSMETDQSEVSIASNQDLEFVALNLESLSYDELSIKLSMAISTLKTANFLIQAILMETELKKLFIFLLLIENYWEAMAEESDKKNLELKLIEAISHLLTVKMSLGIVF